MHRRDDLTAIVVTPDTTIDLTVRQMAVAPSRGAPAGIAVVVDAGQKVIGVVTDGDVRRAYAAGIPFDRPVEHIMVRDPVAVPDSLPRREVLRRMFDEVRFRPRLRASKVDKILVLDAEGCLVDVLSFFDLALENDVLARRVVVVGVGHVGLPIAAFLASMGFNVVGIDRDQTLVSEYRSGRCRIRENGLGDLLLEVTEKRRLALTSRWEEAGGDIYIVCVGTPVAPNGAPDFGGLLEVAEQTGRCLKHGDLVILRSTVPVGSTRRVLVPALEKAANLKAGPDFGVAYAPERAMAGRVLEELRTLPQVLGGLTDHCLDQATRFLTHLSNCVITTESLEAAEIVKLANNTFRDLCFAFANELAVLCEHFNIDAFKVIDAANERYPRDRIPMSSPGVGGYCLKKDAYLYSYPLTDGARFRPQLGALARAVHAAMPERIVRRLREFSRRSGKALEKMAILVIGVAFKGEPETADVRDSVSLDVCQLLRREGVRDLRAFDFTVDAATINGLGLRAVTLEEGFDGTDAVLFLNNHADHRKIDVTSLARRANRPLLFFDGWHQFARELICGLGGVTYATMGFMSEGA